MEDQQPAAGDLSADDAEKAAPESHPQGKRSRHRMPRSKARREALDAAPETTDDDTPEPSQDTDTDETVAPQQIVFVERKPPGRRAPIAIGAAAALFVGASAFAGATLAPYLAERATVDTKLDIARTAANAITTLWTYTPENMEQLADRSSRYLGGDFQAQYRKYIDAIVPTNKQAQVTNSTEVVGAAVESLNGEEATAIIYTNTTSTSPLSKNIPSMRYVSYRLTLHREDADWLVTGMTSITNLDLTPQI